MFDNDNETNLAKILRSPDKLTREAESVLARLYRQILADIRMDTGRWNRLMQRMLDNPRNRFPKRGGGRSSAKGNLNKLLSAKTMSIRTFEKGIILLTPLSFRLECHITWKDKSTTVHSVSVKVPQNPLLDMDEDEDDVTDSTD